MSTSKVSSGGFWRCPKCNTPNLNASYIAACMGCGTLKPPAGFEAADAPADRGAGSKAPPLPRAPAPRLIATVAGYGGFLALLWVILATVGDRWWVGALLTMSPRWVLLAPLAGFGVWAWRKRRGWIGGAVVLEAIVVLGPLMGFNIPWSLLAAKPDGPRIRIMTLNREALMIDNAGFFRYLKAHKIDVLCFQEFRAEPHLETMLTNDGWSFNANKSIASRFPILSDFPRLPERNADPRFYTAVMDRSRIKGPDGREITVASVHMPTPRWGYKCLAAGDLRGFQAKLDWWDAELARLAAFEAETDPGPTLIAGDFNNSPDAFMLVDLRNRDVYRSAFEDAGVGWGYTRPSEFSWVRIDQILASPAFTFTSCWVGPAFGSDHKSLIAEAIFAR